MIMECRAKAMEVIEAVRGKEPDYSSDYLDCWNCEVGGKLYRLVKRRIKGSKGFYPYEERVEVKKGGRWNLIWRRRV